MYAMTIEYSYNNINTELLSKNKRIVRIAVSEIPLPPNSVSIDRLRKIAGDVKIKRVSYSFNRGNATSNIDVFDFSKKNDHSEKKNLNYTINYYGYNDLKYRYVSGDYIVETKNTYEFNNFVNNVQNSSFFSITQLDHNLYFGAISSPGYLTNYCYLTIAISSLLLILQFNNLLKGERKKIAVLKMFGFSNSKMYFKLIQKRIFAISKCIIGTMIFFSLFISFKYNFSLNYWIFNIKLSLLFCIAVCLILSFFVLLELLKNKYYLPQNVSEKTEPFHLLVSSLLTITAVVIVSFLVQNNSAFARDYKNFKDLMSINNYANVDTSIMILDETVKDITTYRNKHKKLWSLADKNGGVFILPGNRYLGEFVEFNDALFVGDIVVINNNYLKEVSIFDIEGKRIRDIHNDKNTITVLIPKKYKNDKRVYEYIRDEHLFRVSEGFLKKNFEQLSSSVSGARTYSEFKKSISSMEKAYIKYIGPDVKKLKEKIIYIDNSQKFFSFSNEFPLNKEQNNSGKFITSPIVFIINAENFNDIHNKYARYGGTTYSSSIDSGYMHFKIKDYKNPIKDIYPLLKEVGLNNDTSKVHTIADFINREINEYKIQSSIFFILIIFISISIFTLLEHNFRHYLEKNKKKISVKYFMGFDRLKIFKYYLAEYVGKAILSAVLITSLFSLRDIIFYRFNFTIHANLLFPTFAVYTFIEVLYLLYRIKTAKLNYIDLK